MTYLKVEIYSRKIKLTAEFLRRAILFKGRERLCYTEKISETYWSLFKRFWNKKKKKSSH